MHSVSPFEVTKEPKTGGSKTEWSVSEEARWSLDRYKPILKKSDH